jgi:hypothetical protein
MMDAPRTESSLIVPAFDRADLVEEVASDYPSFAGVYARVVDATLSGSQTFAVGVPVSLSDDDVEEVLEGAELEAAMCARYFRGELGEAATFAKRVLEGHPTHAAAVLIIAETCLGAIDPMTR